MFRESTRVSVFVFVWRSLLKAKLEQIFCQKEYYSGFNAFLFWFCRFIDVWKERESNDSIGIEFAKLLSKF